MLAGPAVVALEVPRHHPTPSWDVCPARSMAEWGVSMGFAYGIWQHQPHPRSTTQQGCELPSATGSFTARPGLALTAFTGDGCIGCQLNSPAPFLVVL